MTLSESNKQEESSQAEFLRSVSRVFLPWDIFFELIKAKQSILLLFTVFFSFLISSWEVAFEVAFLPLKLIMVLIGLFLAISGSTMLNMYIDRDIDAVMERTKKRAIPTERVYPRIVLVWGIIINFSGILICGLFINFITMIVVFLGSFFDVIVYSLILKRRTKFSVIFGGIAGGLPAMAGRTAVIGTVDIIAVLLATFILFWIPLHILTLALLPRNLEGYTKAGVPMWPVVSGKISTTRMIAISAVVTSLAILITGILLNIHIIPLIPILVFSSSLIVLSILNLIRPSEKKTFTIFKLASMYMAFSFLWLFVGQVVSSLINFISNLILI